MYTTVSYSLLLSFAVAGLAVLISTIAFDKVAAAVTSLAFVAIAVAVCTWFYWCTQGYSQNHVHADLGAEYVSGATKSLIYNNPVVHV